MFFSDCSTPSRRKTSQQPPSAASPAGLHGLTAQCAIVGERHPLFESKYEKVRHCGQITRRARENCLHFIRVASILNCHIRRSGTTGHCRRGRGRGRRETSEPGERGRGTEGCVREYGRTQKQQDDASKRRTRSGISSRRGRSARRAAAPTSACRI